MVKVKLDWVRFSLVFTFNITEHFCWEWRVRGSGKGWGMREKIWVVWVYHGNIEWTRFKICNNLVSPKKIIFNVLHLAVFLTTIDLINQTCYIIFFTLKGNFKFWFKFLAKNTCTYTLITTFHPLFLFYRGPHHQPCPPGSATAHRKS